MHHLAVLWYFAKMILRIIFLDCLIRPKCVFKTISTNAIIVLQKLCSDFKLSKDTNLLIPANLSGPQYQKEVELIKLIQ